MEYQTRNRSLARTSMPFSLAFSLSLLVLLSFLTIPGIAEENQSFTLHEVLVSTLQTNEQILMADERVFRSERDMDKAYSTLYPKITLEGNITRYPEKTAILGSQTVLLQTKESYNLQARITQPLYEGGKLWSGLRIARGGIQMSRQSQSGVREDLLFQAAQAYYNVLKARETLAVEKRNVARLEEHLRQARIRYQVGEVTRSVVLRAEAEYAGGEASYTMSENSLSVLKARLRVLAGLPEAYTLQEPEHGQDPKDQISPQNVISTPGKAVVGGDAEEESPMKEQALRHRTDYLRVLEAEAVAKEQVAFTRGDFLPSLSLEGIYFQRGQDPKSTFFIDESWSVALRLDYPLFEGGLRRASLQQARSSLREARLSRFLQEKEVGVDVHNAVLNIQSAEQILKARNRQVDFAKENFEMVSKQFQYGLATNMDVLDANTLLSQAERDQVHALMERELAHLGLQKSLGILITSLNLEKDALP